MNFFTDLFRFKHSCKHERVTPDLECGYCPDCGKLIENEWYITRCECCGIKLKAMSRGDKIIPQHQFCSNCGSQNFSVEKLEKINFIDINFAVLVKKEVEETRFCSSTYCWQEKTDVQPKLLV